MEALYAEVFPTAVIRSTSTFERLGGDSLTFVEASLGLEQFIGRLPANWPELTVQQLQARVHGAPQGAARRWAVVESAIVLRALAMFGIVAGHFDLIRHAGGAYFLLVAAGFSFSRFQLTQVLRTASVRPILTGAAKVAVPALLMLWAMSFMNGNYVPLQLVLLGNWAIPGKLNFGYWFVEVLPQVLLLVAAGLWFAPLRRVVKKTPYNSSVAFVVGALALSHAAQWLWTADHLYNRVPHMLLWLFALGWLVHRSEDTQQRLLTTAIVVVAPLLDAQPGPFDNFLASGMPWVWVGGVVLLWMPTLRLPRLTSALTHRVAGASLFIFLLHYSGRSLLHRMGLDIHPALDVAAGIAIGIGGWVLWERGTRWMASTLASIRPGWKTTVVNTVVTQW